MYIYILYLQCMRLTRLAASNTTAFACVCMGSQCMRFTRLSASIKTAFAFFFVSHYNACVSHACLHRLRRLLRFLWYGVTMHAFHTRVCIGLKRLLRFPWNGVTMHTFHTLVCIYYDDFCVFLRIALQCIRFTRVSASFKTAFTFSLVWRQSTCVSHACLHLLRRPLRFSSYRIAMHAFHTLVCIY